MYSLSKKYNLFLQDEPEDIPDDYVFHANLWHPEQRGYLLSYDGNDKLAATIANFRSADSLGTYELTNFKSSSTANNQTLFASCDIGTTTSFLHIYVAQTTGRVTISTQDAGGTVNTVSGTLNVCDGKRHYIQVKSSGTAWSIIVDGLADTLIIVAGSNTGDWFADVTLRDNVTHGVKTTTGDGSWAICEMGQHRIYSRELSDAECFTNYSRGWKAAPSDITGLVYNLPCTEGTGNPVETVAAVNPTLTGATWVEGLIDRSTNAYPLTSFGSPTWGNTGRTLAGAQSIKAGGLADLNISASDCSFGAWVKTTDTGATFKIIMGKVNLSANEYSLYQSNANKLTFRMADGAVNATAVANSTMVSGTWYFVFGVRLSNVLYLFINAVQQTTTGSFSGSPNTTAKQFRVGSDEAGTSYQWIGTIGEGWGYNRGVSLAEITQVYLAGKGSGRYV